MTQAEPIARLEFSREYWIQGLPNQIAAGLCGIIAVLVALKSVAYDPAAGGDMTLFNHSVRAASFAALTIWISFTIGIRRRGVAAMIALGFAVIVELFLVPTMHGGASTIVTANLGIVFAYCALQLYWNAIVQQSDHV